MVKYLIENKRDEEARRVLTTLLKTKAVSPIYHVLLKDVLDRQNPGDKAPENEETEEALSIDEAIKKFVICVGIWNIRIKIQFYSTLKSPARPHDLSNLFVVF